MGNRGCCVAENEENTEAKRIALKNKNTEFAPIKEKDEWLFSANTQGERTPKPEDVPDSLKALPSVMPELSESVSALFSAIRTDDYLNDNDLKIRFSLYPVLGPYRYEDGSTYEGQYRNGLRHGRGRQVCVDGSLYEGYWISDRKSIRGVLVKSDGTVILGLIWHGGFRGEVDVRCANGDLFTGGWQRGYPNGQGQLIETTSHRTYRGGFVDGLKQGEGVIEWQDGSVYEGDFFNNKIHGQGKKVWYDGREYEGYWSDGKMNGEGKFTWPDGRMYLGNYKNDKKNGYGEMYFPSGVVFKGTWSNGKENGKGELINSQGISEFAEWKDGSKL